MIYADNAATTRLDAEAFEAMKPYLLNDYSNPSQPYSFSRSSKKAIKDARQVIAECIGAEPDEIYFTSGGTESDNWAIKGTVMYGGQKRCVITSEFDTFCNLSCKANKSFKKSLLKYILYLVIVPAVALSFTFLSPIKITFSILITSCYI